MNRDTLLNLVLSLAACSGVSMALDPARYMKPPVVSFVDAAKPACWSRAYTADHMTSHPKQKVSSIAISYVPAKKNRGETQQQWDPYADKPAFFANVIVRLSGDDRTFLGPINCTSGGAKTLKCGIDGDGGMFDVTLQSDGSVQLDNPAGFWVSVIPAVASDEPADDGVSIDPKDDHRSFVMPKASGGLCDKDWPGVAR